LYRTGQLYAFARNRGFELAICHGSRAQMLAATLLRIPVILMFDYEGSKGIPLADHFLNIRRCLVPEALENSHLANKGIDLNKVYKYPGIKEDVYLFDFRPDPDALRLLGLDPAKVIVVMRPPASQAHYHNPKADTIYEALLRRFAREADTQVVLLARTAQQKELAVSIYRQGRGVLTLPEAVLNGLDLLWQADLVISGGGTMVREGAGLGVPAYSIFCGPTPDVDRYLVSQGRLTFVRDVDDIGAIRLVKRDSTRGARRSNNLTPCIVDRIMECLNNGHGGGRR
jgi:hypothetical protein